MLSQPHVHSAAGRIVSLTNSNDAIGNGNRDFPACKAVKVRGTKLYITTKYVNLKKHSKIFKVLINRGKPDYQGTITRFEKNTYIEVYCRRFQIKEQSEIFSIL
jgi:hypothetical protein